MGRESVISFYCSDIAGTLKALGTEIQEAARFPDFELLETQDATVFFDARKDLIASPIQTFLELASGDRREAETAEQVRRRLLSELTKE